MKSGICFKIMGVGVGGIGGGVGKINDHELMWRCKTTLSNLES